MAIRTLSSVMLMMVMLAGCKHYYKEGDQNLVDEKIPSLIDKEKFIEENRERAEEDVLYGPQLQTKHEPVDLRDEYNVQIAKEESYDYVDYYDDGTGRVFPIDVNVENMDIRTFANMLSDMTGVNILVSEEVGGFVSAKLEDVLWTNALDSILSLKSLAKHINTDANIMRIHDQKTIVELENFERQRRQDLQTTMALAKASRPAYTEVFKLFYTRPDEIKTILDGVFTATSNSGAGGSDTANIAVPQITADSRTNSLIIKGLQDELDVVRSLIKELDARTQQVFIEAFIVEVTEDFEKRLGTRLGLDVEDSFSADSVIGRVSGIAGTAGSEILPGDPTASLTNLGVAGPNGGISFLLGLGSGFDLKTELTALEDEGVTRLVSNPRIFTLDNQEAVIFQGTEVPYETVSESGTQVQFKEAGLRLAVTPTVVGDGNLLISLAVNKDSVDTSLGENPPISKSEIKTNLVTRDGSIVVIGGIYTESDSSSIDKVPGLGDVPGAGRLFRRDEDNTSKTELMIFIAPRII